MPRPRCRVSSVLSVLIALPVVSEADEPAIDASPPIYAADETAAGSSPLVSNAVDNLPAIEVTAVPLAHPHHVIAQPVSILEGDRLLRQRGGGLGETLASEPGVSTSDFGPGSSRPIIRGQSGARVRVLHDGIGSLDASTISDDHAVSLDPMEAEQIEVLKGPATLLYGSGAIGGVVNVVTDRIPRRVPDGVEGDAELRYDTATVGRTGSLSLDAGRGSFALHLHGLVRETENYDSGVGKVLNSATRTRDHSLGTAWLGERGSAGVAYGRYESVYQVPGGEGYIDLVQHSYDAEAAIERPLPGIDRLQARLGYGDYTHTEFEAPGIRGTTFNNEEVEGRIEALHAPLAGWSGVLGLQVQHRDFEAIGDEAVVPPVTRRSLGLFLMEERDWDDWHFELGGRIERNENDATGANPDVDEDVYSVSGSVLWRFAPEHSAGLTLTRAQRAPDIQELYSDGPHIATGTFEIGNPGLREEVADAVDFTLRRHEGRFTWRVNLYAYFYSDYVYLEGVDENGGLGADGILDRVDEEGRFDPAGELSLQRFTQADARFYGGELEAGYRLFDNRQGSLDLRLFADYVRARLDDGTNLPRIPPLRYGAGLDWTRGPWSAALELTRVANQGRRGPLETGTEGYTDLDIDLAYDLSAGGVDYTLFLRGTNLLDEEARRHTSFLKEEAPLPGRSAVAGIRIAY